MRQLLGVLRMENTGRSDVGQLQVRSRGCVTVEKRATLPFRHRCSVLSADGHRLWTDLLDCGMGHIRSMALEAASCAAQHVF